MTPEPSLMPAHASRAVIVTGASRGLGKAIALRFGRAGDRVVVNYREREEDALAVAESIRAKGGEAAVFQADVRNTSEVEAMVDDTLRRWSAVQVFVNNAGITRDALAIRMSDCEWDDVLDTNLRAPFLCVRAVSRVMMRQRSGHIISVSSISGVQGREGQSNYAASKAGLIGLTKAAAMELGRFNIKANAVLPGYLPTHMGASVHDKVMRRIIDQSALGRTSDPDEVAEFIYRLSLMSNVSGQVFNLDSRII